MVSGLVTALALALVPLALALIPIPGAKAQPTSALITVDGAVERALSRPALRSVMDAEVSVSAAEETAEGVWPNPQVTYAREQVSAPGGDEREEVVGLSQTLPISGRRGLRADAAALRTDAARLDGQAHARRVASETRRRFWAVVYQQRRHQVTDSWMDHLRSAQSLVAARKEAGEASAYDVLRMEREARRARTELDRSRVELESAWMELLVMTGPMSAPEGWPRVAGDLAPTVAAAQGPSAPEDRLDVQAWARRAEAAKLEASAAGRGWIPDVTLSGGYKRMDAGGETAEGFTAGVGLSVPLFDRGQGEGARAQASQNRAAAIKTLVAENARLEQASAAGRVQRLARLAQEARAAHEGATRELERTAQAGWTAGELDLLQLLDVYRGSRDERLTLLSLERDARDALEALRLTTLEETP